MCFKLQKKNNARADRILNETRVFSEARPAYCLLCKSGRPPVLFSSLDADSVGAAAARARAPQTPAPPRGATQRLIPGLQRLRRRRRLQRREGKATPPRSVRGVCPGCVVVAQVIPAVAVAHAACGTSRTALCTRQATRKKTPRVAGGALGQAGQRRVSLSY